MILHDLDFNPYNDKQAEDRCHRVGQTKEVGLRKTSVLHHSLSYLDSGEGDQVHLRGHYRGGHPPGCHSIDLCHLSMQLSSCYAAVRIIFKSEPPGCFGEAEVRTGEL